MFKPFHGPDLRILLRRSRSLHCPAKPAHLTAHLSSGLKIPDGDAPKDRGVFTAINGDAKTKIQYVKELIISYLQLFYFCGLFTYCLFSAVFMSATRFFTSCFFSVVFKSATRFIVILLWIHRFYCDFSNFIVNDFRWFLLLILLCFIKKSHPEQH